VRLDDIRLTERIRAPDAPDAPGTPRYLQAFREDHEIPNAWTQHYFFAKYDFAERFLCGKLMIIKGIQFTDEELTLLTGKEDI
jgi:hypothetical protein